MDLEKSEKKKKVVKRFHFSYTLTKLLTSTSTLLFQNLSFHNVVVHQVIQPCTCMEYKHSSLLLHITIQPHTPRAVLKHGNAGKLPGGPMSIGAMLIFARQ